MTVSPHAPARLLGVALAAAVGLSACGGGSSSKPAFCADRDALQKSLTQLEGMSVSLDPSNLSALGTQLKQVDADAKALVQSAKTEFAPQTDALRASLTAVETSVRQAAASPSTGTLSAAATQVSNFATAFSNLSTAVKEKC
jgi:hypothetical protein